MGIGRKKFLQIVSAALVGLSIDPLKAVAINSDLYVNKKLGIMLTKPKNWDFVSIKDFGKLKLDQVLSDEFEPNKEEVWKELSDPIIVIAKYGLDKPEFDGKFSPAITIFVSHKNEIIDPHDDTNEDFETIVGMVASGTEKLFKNYSIIRNITPYKLSESNGFDSEWSWTFESIEHKKSYECKTWSILIEKGDYFYSFNMIDSEQAGEVEAKNFQEFVKSIKIS